jgi:hypothetical protein
MTFHLFSGSDLMVRVNANPMKNEKQKTIHKAHLPQKICPVCQRPFSWRKKWQHVWEEVRYCSARCRSQA